MSRSFKLVLHILGCVLVIILCAFFYHMDNPVNKLPRNWSIPALDPYDPHFVCKTEAGNLPLIDAQADTWFRMARALEDPNIFPEDRETERIVELTRKAAERRHWKALLNLASLYAEGAVPKRNAEDAVLLVEEGIRLGIPAAYDRMGTYYVNGTGVSADSDKGHAFWQHAARIGSMHAQSYLGTRFNTGVEHGTRWSNIPVATRMLECAFSQGDGGAMLALSYIYRTERTEDGNRIGWMTPNAKERALRALHEGVKMGCRDCARDLAVDFRNPLDQAYMVVPHIDRARAERYSMLDDALSFNPYRRLPNLDKILPLPPADLPPWDGTRESLLNAAMGVTFSADVLIDVPRPPSDRHFIDPSYHLRKTSEATDTMRAPFAGYWQPYIDGKPAEKRLPGLYGKDESFDAIYVSDGLRSKLINGVVWVYHVTVRNSEHEVDPVAVPGLTRKVSRPVKPLACHSHESCAVGGIWQPWVPEVHPLQAIINQPWRQVFLRKDQPFPKPRRDWLLDLDEKEVMWHLMEQTGPGMVTKSGG